MSEKYCPRCGQVRPTSQFYKNQSKPDGFDSYCKDCAREYRSNPDMRAAQVRRVMKYRQTEQGKETHRRANKKYRESEQGRRSKLQETKRYQDSHPQETSAHRAVNDAVRYGNLAPIHTRKCAKCNSQAVHYHHEDYSNKLDVVPLCQKCHQRVHGGKGSG